MDVMKKFRFEMSLVLDVGSRRVHENYFERYGIDWQKAVWTKNPTPHWDETYETFKSLDGKCEATTQASFFVPYKEGPVNLEDYM